MTSFTDMAMRQLTIYGLRMQYDFCLHEASPIHETIGMGKPSSRQILADNLTRMMERSLDLKSQNALAARAKVAQSHVGRIRRQESAATVDMLDALASALGVQAWELLTDSDAAREEAMRRLLGAPPSRGEEPTKRRRSR